MPFCAHKDVEIVYARKGAGPGILMIHGTGQTGDGTWDEIAQYLAADNTIAYGTYSGSGTTRIGRDGLSLRIFAEQMLAVADAADLDTFDVVGHSLGACVAIRMALDHPDRVKRLVLAAGFASSRDSRMLLQFRLWERLAETDILSLAEQCLLSGFSQDFLAGLSMSTLDEIVEDTVARTNWDGFVQQIAVNREVELEEDVPAIAQPTLVIGCARDCIVAVEHSKRLAELLPDVRYAEMNTGHAGPVEQPEAFAKLVKSFLT